jgi:hypothetical protein
MKPESLICPHPPCLLSLEGETLENRLDLVITHWVVAHSQYWPKIDNPVSLSKIEILW